jgi:hypothetical protein
MGSKMGFHMKSVDRETGYDPTSLGEATEKVGRFLVEVNRYMAPFRLRQLNPMLTRHGKNLTPKIR